MKRLILTLASLAAIGGPMFIGASAEARPGNGRWERNDDRWERRDDRREERRDDRRDGRRGDRWDSRRYNGYYYNNRWFYGPPPQAYWDAPNFRPGYANWRRGAYLPSYYRGYVVNDYYAYRLRSPPRGYHWVRVNNDYLLVAIATGLIFDVIANN
ncbi:MAG: RcnB family protein [Caulobacteraceae bacterium]